MESRMVSTVNVRQRPRTSALLRKGGRAGKARPFFGLFALVRAGTHRMYKYSIVDCVQVQDSCVLGVMILPGGLGGLLSITTVHNIQRFSRIFPHRRRLTHKYHVRIDLRKYFLFADTRQSWLHSSFRYCTVVCSLQCSLPTLVATRAAQADWIAR
jgi:hypothetical protein